MGRDFCYLVLLFSVAGNGCAMPNKLSFSNPTKQKQNSNLADSKSSGTHLGSPEFSYSNKLKDPVKTHLAYATWCEQSGNLQEAQSSFTKALEKSPKNAEAMLGLARVDRLIGREDEADARLRKALKQHPKDPKVLVAVGQVYASRNQWPDALEKMKAAHELAPFDKVYEYHLAVVEARMGDIPSAIEHFTRSVGPAEAYYNAGYILKEQGNTVEAEKYLMNALKLKPELKQAESTLASIRTGRPNNPKEVQPASFDERF